MEEDKTLVASTVGFRAVTTAEKSLPTARSAQTTGKAGHTEGERQAMAKTQGSKETGEMGSSYSPAPNKLKRDRFSLTGAPGALRYLVFQPPLCAHPPPLPPHSL